MCEQVTNFSSSVYL